jgi:hypothetical protein
VSPEWIPATNENQHPAIFAFRKVAADRAKATRVLACKTTTPDAIVDFIVFKQPVTNRHPVCDSEVLGLT